MTGKNCPFCGAEIEPGKARDKAVCPSCGREFDYNTLNAEARGIIDGKRWAREDEERKGAVAIRRKRAAAAAPVAVTSVLFVAVLIAAISLLATGDALSFFSGAPIVVTAIFVGFGLTCGSAVWLILKIRKRVYNGPLLYGAVSAALAALLALGIVSVAISMHNYGRSFADGYVYCDGADGAELIEYRGEVAADFVIPESVGGVRAVSVGKGLLKGKTEVRSLVVPEGVKTIEDEAFRGMTSLESVSLPQSLKRIGRFALADCASIKSIVVPGETTYIGVSAFSGCNALEEIELPFIGEYRDREVHGHFGYIFGAKSYDYNSDCVPKSLKVVRSSGARIAPNAFNGLSTLKSVELSGAVTVGENAFSDCTGIDEIILPATVTELHRYAFDGWTENQSIALPSALESVKLGYCEAKISYY